MNEEQIKQKIHDLSPKLTQMKFKFLEEAINKIDEELIEEDDVVKVSATSSLFLLLIEDFGIIIRESANEIAKESLQDIKDFYLKKIKTNFEKGFDS